MSKFIDIEMANRGLTIQTVHGKGLVVKVSKDLTLEDRDSVAVECNYILFDELRLSEVMTEAEATIFDSYVYSGYWNINFIEKLTGVTL